jgi:hypothetical protein
VETLGVVVAGVGEPKRSKTRHGVGFAGVVMELVAEVVLDFIGGVLKHAVNVRGVGVTVVVNPGMMHWVPVGAGRDLSVTNVLKCAEGVQIALDGLGDYDFVIWVLILDCDGNVDCNLVPIGFDAVFQCLTVGVSTGVSGGLGDIASKGGGSMFKGKDGEGIGVMDRTVYDLRVCEETS